MPSLQGPRCSIVIAYKVKEPGEIKPMEIIYRILIKERRDIFIKEPVKRIVFEQRIISIDA